MRKISCQKLVKFSVCSFCFNLFVCAHFQTVANEERTSSHDFLTGQVFRGVETLGKELFMYFDQKALR